MSPSQVSQISSPQSKNLPSSQISSLQNPLPSPSEDQNNSYLPGRLLIQFKTGANHGAGLRSCAHCLFEKNKTFRSASADDSDSLDQLFEMYRPAQIKPLYRTSAEEGQSAEAISVHALRSQWEQKLSTMKSRFSNRANRSQIAGTNLELFHVYRIEFDSNTDIEIAAAEFSKDEHVVFAHPDYILNVAQNQPVSARNDLPELTLARPQPPYPNDPYFYSQGSWGQNYADLWGIKKIQAPQFWAATNHLGEGITVAVIDTGIDYSHPDLAENIWINESEGLIADGIDQDGNGFVDDSIGWDFVHCIFFDIGGQCLQFQEPDADPLDLMGHGTHVAGTIAAVGNNNFGVIGVAPKSRIMVLKAINDQGRASASDLADALFYATLNGADVINNSWACAGRCYSVPIFEAPVQLAYQSGVALVFSAGNSNDEAAYYYPQNAPETITVAATDHLDARCSFTNRGVEVDLAAPGGESSVGEFDFLANSVLSLRAANTDLYAMSSPLASGLMVVNDFFYRAKGTSMAAPHVSGAIALLMNAHPDWDIEEIRYALRNSVDPLSSTDPYEFFSLWGRLDIAQATAAASPMKVNIFSPRSGIATNWLANSVVVRGTAMGEQFHHYQLFHRRRWSDDWHPGYWYPIGEPVYAPVENGDLGVWDWSGLDIGEYLIRLTVTDTNGVEHSDTVDTFLLCNIQGTPILTATDNDFCDRIRVSWTSTPHSFTHLLMRGMTPDFDFYAEGESLGLQEGLFYEDTNVEPGVAYYYRVLPYNYCHPTPHYSNTDSGVAAFIPEETVSGVNASDGQFCNFVQVNWTPLSGISNYELWRCPVNVPSGAVLVGRSLPNQNFIDDYTIPTDQTHYYWVKVADTGCDPSYGFGVPDTGSRLHAGIGVPSAVSASDGNPCDNIRITWQPASNAQNYQIWRSTNSSPSSAIPIGGSPTSPFFDNSAAGGVNYWYWVEARNDCGLSAMSPVPNMGFFGAPLPPPYVEASDGEYCGYVGILWAPSDTATNYRVYRGPNSNPNSATPLGETNGNFWDDQTATPGSAYFYFVRASRNICGWSDFTPANLGYRPIPPGVVQNVFATNGTSCDFVRLVWDSFPTATKYSIYRNTANNSSNASYIGFANAGEEPFFHDGTATPGTYYYYWVRAENDCGLGPFSFSNQGWRCVP